MDEEVVEGIVDEIKVAVDDAISELSLDQAIQVVEAIEAELGFMLIALRDDLSRQLGG